MPLRRRILLTVLVVACGAAPAQAQWVVTPYLGSNFGDVEKGKGGIGGSVAYFGGRVALEFDLERHWHFFKDSDLGNTGRQLAEDIDTRGTSVMGNLLVPIRIKRAPNWRPYGTAGLGVIRATFKGTVNQADVHQNDLAFNLGGGVMHRLGSRVGLRGDLRYFRAFADEGRTLPAGQRGDLSGFYRDYGFLRVTFGVTLGFPR